MRRLGVLLAALALFAGTVSPAEAAPAQAVVNVHLAPFTNYIPVNGSCFANFWYGNYGQAFADLRFPAGSNCSVLTSVRVDSVFGGHFESSGDCEYRDGNQAPWCTRLNGPTGERAQIPGNLFSARVLLCEGQSSNPPCIWYVFTVF